MINTQIWLYGCIKSSELPDYMKCCVQYLQFSVASIVCSSSLGWMMAAVLQLSVVRSILFFVMLVLWTDEQYDYGDVSN